MISDFADYLIDSLTKNRILEKLNVYSKSVELTAYRLTVKDDEKDVVKILGDGLKSNEIAIPGKFKGKDIFAKFTGFTDYLKHFGTQIAERIKESFSPLFDPENEQICDRLKEVNSYVKQNVGAVPAFFIATQTKLKSAQVGLIENAQKKIAKINSLDEGSIKIGASDTICSVLLLRLLKKFNVDYPNIHITVLDTSTAQAIERIKSGSVDLSFVTLPTADDSAVEITPIMPIHDCFVAGEHMPNHIQTAIQPRHFC
jgi:hypothetical protein